MLNRVNPVKTLIYLKFNSNLTVNTIHINYNGLPSKALKKSNCYLLLESS